MMQLQRELEMEEKLLENEQRELEILKTEYLQGQDLEVIMKEYQEVEESLHNIQTTLEKNQKKIIQGQVCVYAVLIYLSNFFKDI